MDLIIVTGMSGAGKSLTINALEDMGYYCVDNVPPRLVAKFAELPMQSDGKIARIALVVDVRSKELFAEYVACLDELEATESQIKTVFLDCDDATLLRRYKETRRRHPLLSSEVTSVEQAICKEREMMSTARERADYRVDSSHLSAAKMRSYIQELFSDGISQSMVVSIYSFGFKYGTPTDADLVFDVRCLPNPFYVEELRELTGLDAPVREYVLQFKQAQGLIPRLLDLLEYLMPLYVQEGKSQLVIAIGCTGGKHRSVVFTQLVASHLRDIGNDVHASHRDMHR